MFRGSQKEMDDVIKGTAGAWSQNSLSGEMYCGSAIPLSKGNVESNICSLLRGGGCSPVE